jgi:hypothetical protein
MGSTPCFYLHLPCERENDRPDGQNGKSGCIIHDIQTKHLNIESMTVFLNLVQESQELLSALRHTMRGKSKFEKS